VQDFPGHKGPVTGLTFQSGTNQLFSCSDDRSIKIWSLDDRAYIETLFGHTAQVTAVDCLRKERVVSVGSDRTCRIWKVPEESQLMFKGHTASGDTCKFVNQTTFVSGSQDGSLSLWSMFKKKAVHTVRNAHRREASAGPDASTGTTCFTSSRGWIGAVATCANTDLVASGAGDGCVRLWSIKDSQTGSKSQQLVAHSSIDAPGYVNGLQISKNAHVLVAAIGQEPRLGRWDRNKASRNMLLVQRLHYDD